MRFHSRRMVLQVAAFGLIVAGVPHKRMLFADEADSATSATAHETGSIHRLPVSERFDDFDCYVHAAMDKSEVPGLAVAVVKDGELALAREYGVCEIGTGRRVNRQTTFPIASCAKTLTAAAVAVLIDEGKLTWDDPVVKHLPEFELSDRYLTEHVTVRDLLCHRTGLQRADLLQDGTGFTEEKVLRRLKHLPGIAEFRTRLIYNNHTYTVLNHLVARVAGQPFEEFIRQRLFQPLSMKLTGGPEEELLKQNRAARHWRSDAGIVPRPFAKTDGLYTTASDLAKWLMLQLAEGTHSEREILNPRTVREMHALHFSEPVPFQRNDNIYAAQFYGAGLGWFVQDYRGRKIVLHSGAWGSVMGMIPEEKLGVVVLSNLDLESISTMLMYDVFDACLVGPKVAWDQGKWQATWLRHEPPGHAYRARDDARAQLNKIRKVGTDPSLPLDSYVGEYESPLYGKLYVQQREMRLLVTFGEHTAGMSHWQDESFYVRSPTGLTFDWLLTFRRSDDGAITDIILKHIGWDRSEKDHVFTRIAQSA